MIEIMVGLVIGMLGFIVVMQVFSLSESRNRTTIAGDDAQNGGAIALHGIQRDIRLSGFGTSAPNIIGCNVLLRAGVTLNALTPVTINHASIPAGDANTDTILINYGTGNSSPEGDSITAQPSTATYTVQTPTSFALNDLVIAQAQARPTPCNLTLDSVTGIPSPGSNVNVETGVAGMANGTLYNLGQSPKILVYAIRNNNLTVCDYIVNNCSIAANTGNETIWIPIASNIVSMRAEYGHDTDAAMNGVVDAYNQTTPTTACGWLKVSAIRIVLVARSNQKDGNAVTAAAPLWSGSAGAAINLSSLIDWNRYRYKTFETLVPIRNIAWQGVVAGC